MPEPKINSNPQKFEGGINEIIGPSEYVDGLYQTFDNIKLNAQGRLVRDWGYTVLPYAAQPVTIGDYILYAGRGQLFDSAVQPWNNLAEPYSPGDVVSYNGRLYQRLTATSNTPPTTPNIQFPTYAGGYWRLQVTFPTQEMISDFNAAPWNPYTAYVQSTNRPYNPLDPLSSNGSWVVFNAGGTPGLYQCMENVLPGVQPNTVFTSSDCWQDVGAYVPPTISLEDVYIKQLQSQNNNPYLMTDSVIFDLTADWNAYTKVQVNMLPSFQECLVVPTYNHLFILSNTNTGYSNPILKFDYAKQDPLVYATPYTCSPIYYDLSTEQFDAVTSSVGQSTVFPEGLGVGNYLYGFTLVDDTGAESQMSNTMAVIGAGPTSSGVGIVNLSHISNTIASSNIMYNSSIKYVNIYRSHSSNISGGYDNNGGLPPAMWFIDQVPFSKRFFSGSGSSLPFYVDYTPDAEAVKQYNDTGTLQVKGNIGFYANLRLHVAGDNNYPHVLFISDASSDNFSADSELIMPLSSSANPISAICNIGAVLYVFNQFFGICRLMPNAYGSSAPYTLYQVSTTYGCDRWDSCCNAGGVIVFVFNKHLYTWDGVNVMDIGIPIEPGLSTATYIKLTYNTQKEYLYINCKDSNFHSLKMYCYSIRHKHFTTESIDYAVVGDKLGQMDDIFFNKQSNINNLAAYNASEQNNMWLAETPNAYTMPIGFNNSTLMGRQAIIAKPLTPMQGFYGMLNKLIIYGLNPVYYDANGNIIGYGLKLEVGADDGILSNIIDASTSIRRGADIRLNISGEDFILKLIWNTPTPNMILNSVAGSEAILDWWGYTYTPTGRTIRETTTGNRIPNGSTN